MTRFQHKFFLGAIAFVATFGILTEAEAETVRVVNYVDVQSTTGGVGNGQDGQAGQNGRNGLPGEDGKDGANGGTVMAGDGQAVVKVKAAIDGETVVDIVKKASSTNEANMEVAELSFTETQIIESLLNKIRLILMDYVLAIF